MNKKYYCQCELIREDEDKKYIQVAWIPEKFASIGKLITIKNDPNKYIWTVAKAYRENMKEATVLEFKSRDYLKQRKSSDV